MKLKYLTFEFDNFDVHTIEGKYADIRAMEISRDYSYADELICSFAVEIDSRANTVHINENNNMQYLPFNWLDYGHISHVVYELEGDDRIYCYPVLWSDSPSVNKFQKSCISRQGNMCIVIDENKGIEDYFKEVTE